MRIYWTALAFAAVNLFGCDSRPHFTASDYNGATLGKGLKPGFLLGTATAAHQIEGGNTNDWTDWENVPGKIHDGSKSGAADDSWNRFDTDLALMKQLGVNAYRFSVEWSRLEPEEGVWDEAAADRYLSWVAKLRANGIEPMVTLYHFTLPRWVAAKGGWESDATIDAFEAFSARVAQKLGGQVDLWCTINEPNVLAIQSYLKGIWPPGKTDQKIAAEVMTRLMKAHARAAVKLRELDTTDANGDGKATQIGIAHHARFFQAATPSVLDGLITGVTDDFFNEAVVRAHKTGRMTISVPGAVSIDEEIPNMKGSFDYLGINYYTRDHVRADLGDPSLSHQYTPDGRPTNDVGWDIYPEGLYQFLKRFSAYGLPMYVAENGMADATGARRPEYLRQHFYALQRASAEGVDVRGYFHWSLIDNFEWADGFETKFGLFRVDQSGPPYTRTPTDAVPVFQEIAKNLGLNPTTP